MSGKNPPAGKRCLVGISATPFTGPSAVRTGCSCVIQSLIKQSRALFLAHFLWPPDLWLKLIHRGWAMRKHRADEYVDEYGNGLSIGSVTTLDVPEGWQPPPREFPIGFAGANPGPSHPEPKDRPKRFVDRG